MTEATGAMEGRSSNGTILWVSIQGHPGAMRTSSQTDLCLALKSPHQSLDTSVKRGQARRQDRVLPFKASRATLPERGSL